MNYRDAVFDLMDDPIVIHDLFFGAAHTNSDAPFHAEMVRDWHSTTPNILTMAFRGSAKSTKAEEAITLEVCFGRVKNVLILGESETRAKERLAAIKHHLEYNADLQETFGIGPGDIWTETKIVTSTGVVVQAYGRGQSLRGVKHLDYRPDFIFLDDIEDRESGSVATPGARDKTKVWLAGTVLPTLAPGGRMRMAATPLHPEALAPTIAKDAKESWTTRTYPIIYKDGDGRWAASWPDRFSLEAVLKSRRTYNEIGKSDVFQQEYMCEAVDQATQTFTDDMFLVAGSPDPRDPSTKVPAQVRSWHAVYAIYDPARTTNVKSATTGKCVASWIGNRLVVWEAEAKKWMPDEIVGDIFNCAEKYSPVAVGVEENGLNEWLLQPIRTRQVQVGTVIPLRPLRAPKGKYDFIRGLQPYFASRSVVFADHLPELRAQLIGFPTGYIDAPNALAYMLHMKLGMPIYDNFTVGHIDAEARPLSNAPVSLLVNSNNQVTTGIAAQIQAGRLVILWDAILDGDPGTVLADMLRSCLTAMMPSLGVSSLNSGAGDRAPRTRPLRLLSSSRHFDEYTVYELRAAVRKAGYELQRGSETATGREEIRTLFKRLSHGQSAIAISPEASWVLRAFAGGYARDAQSTQPIDNAYAVLIEPLEAFAAIMRLGSADDLASPLNYAYTSDGRRYISALARSA